MIERWKTGKDYLIDKRNKTTYFLDANNVLSYRLQGVEGPPIPGGTEVISDVGTYNNVWGRTFAHEMRTYLESKSPEELQDTITRIIGALHDPPKVHTCTIPDGDRILTFDVADLHAAARGLPVEVFDIKQSGCLSSWRWGPMKDLGAFIEHVARVERADMSWPVILSPDGQLLDGLHKVCRAVLDGRWTLDAVRLAELPAPIKTRKRRERPLPEDTSDAP